MEDTIALKNSKLDKVLFRQYSDFKRSIDHINKTLAN